MTAQVFVQIDSQLYTVRGHKIAMNYSLRRSLEWWCDNRLPQRFELNAKTMPGGVLGFAKRSVATQIRKARVRGHQRPNVDSGNLRASMLANRVVRATATRATVTLKGTFPMTSQRRREFSGIPSVENLEMVDVVAETYRTAHQNPALQDRVTLRQRKRS